MIKKEYKSGKIIIENISSDYLRDDIKKRAIVVALIRFITNIIESTLYYFGLYFFCINLIPSERFKRWLNDIQPDIIYCQLPSLELITFINRILKLYEFKLIVHVMDDQPITLNRNVFLKKYWHKIAAKETMSLYNRASLLLSISEGMSREYLKKYGKVFIPFHNPIDLEKWLPFKKNSWEIKQSFKVLYAGRIGLGTNQSLSTICKVVDEINKGNNKIRFDIFSPDYDILHLSPIKKYNGVSIYKPVILKDVPRNISSYDLLVLPYDFNKDSIEFIRLSMPTKASEYMITGTPILVFASEETEVVKHAKLYKWAYCVTMNDENVLKNAILKLYDDIDLRKMYGNTAHKYALNNYDAEKVRKRFMELICNS